MRTVFLISLLFSVFISKIQAQELSEKHSNKFITKNSFQAELFGHGLIYSLNYERVLINKERFKTTGQAGFSYFPPSTGIIGLWVPVVINQLISFEKHHIEIGLGQVFVKDYLVTTEDYPLNNSLGRFTAFRTGYRYQKPDGRSIFRIGFTPFIQTFSSSTGFLGREFYFHPSGGISYGYSF